MLKLRDCGAQGAQYGADFFGGFVFAAGPEEAFQAIAFFAGNYVDVKMGDALADAVIGGDEGSLRLHRQFDGGGEHFYSGEKRLEQGIGQLVDGLQMALGNHEAVSREQGAMVEKSEGGFIFVDEVICSGIAQDFAEGTVGVEFIAWHGCVTLKLRCAKFKKKSQGVRRFLRR